MRSLKHPRFGNPSVECSVEPGLKDCRFDHTAPPSTILPVSDSSDCTETMAIGAEADRRYLFRFRVFLVVLFTLTCFIGFSYWSAVSTAQSAQRELENVKGTYERSADSVVELKQAAEKQEEALKSAQDALKELEEKEKSIEEEVAGASKKKEEVQSDIHQQEEILKNLQEEVETVKGEKKESEDQVSNLQQQVEEQGKVIKGLESKLKELQKN